MRVQEELDSLVLEAIKEHGYETTKKWYVRGRSRTDKICLFLSIFLGFLTAHLCKEFQFRTGILVTIVFISLLTLYTFLAISLNRRERLHSLMFDERYGHHKTIN